ncbi:hypothetical protein P3L10_010457 [Capsicum annuum]
MGSWSYPDASLEDLVKMVKGFIDMTILASGHQSSGRLAHWDSQNIKNALQLALFLEHVMRDLSSSDDYRDSLEELDAALCGMISNPYFPQGLAHFSSKVLCKVSEFMLEHLISVFPLRDEHLKALLTANVEMDYHMHPKTDTDDSIRCPLSLFTAQALERRQQSVSLISSAETGLDILSSGLRDLYVREDDDALTVKVNQTTNFMTEERRIGSAVWNSWKSRSLSYLLDKRTIRLVSGASLLFSAPKSQWIQVFQRMDISSQLEDSLCEIVELLLLGCVVDRWSFLIDRVMLTSYGFVTTSRLFNVVHNLVQRGCRAEIINSKEQVIIEYLEVFLDNRLYLLWELSPVLEAFAIPSWYTFQILILSDSYPVLLSCSSTKERKEHRECDVAERIWCLHVCHVGGSDVESGSSSA